MRVRRQLPANVTSGTYYFRFYFRPASLPAANAMIAVWQNSTPADIGYLELLTTGEIKLTSTPGSETITSATQLVGGTWYRIELKYLLSDSVGEYALRIDGNDEGTPLSGIDSLATNFRYFCLGNSVNATFDALYDDVAWNDTTNPGDGSNLSWCGPGKIALIKPASDTATIEWTPNTGTDHTALVDDVPGTPDDATTYNGDTQATNIDRLNVTALPSEVPSDATINIVDVYARVGNNSTTGTPSMLLYLWDEDGTLTPGPALSTDINGWRICATNEHLVYNAAAGSKTKADIGNFDIGYKGNTADSKNKWISALWANVEWIEAEGGGDTELTVAGLSHSHAAGAPVLAQAHLLALGNLAHGQSLGAVALTQAHTLAVGGLVHAQSLDAPILTQVHTLGVGSLTHANALDALALTQAHALIVQSLGHAQSLDGIDFDLSVLLVVANLGHTQGLEALALTQAHLLVVDALGHAQLLDAVAFGAPPAGTVPVRYLVGQIANVVPVETVLVAAPGVIPVREFAGPANVVPVREAPAEWPRVLVRKV